jgi:hypothetical protein
VLEPVLEPVPAPEPILAADIATLGIDGESHEPHSEHAQDNEKTTHS